MGHGRHSLAAQAALAGEYPPLPDPKFTSVVDGIPCITLLEHGLLMRAYVDADRAMRAQAAPVCKECDGTGTVAGSQAHFACPQCKAAPENIRSILVRCRDFIDTTQVPAYPVGADLADEIDVLLAAQSDPRLQADSQPAPVAQEAAEDAARLDWLLGEGRRMAIDSCDGEYRVVDDTWSLVVTDWMPTPRAAIDAARKQGGS
ncbi:hypothetical protein [EBPR siphovirus 1]|nr:hypothetical protein [EBPR siphovirus 1]